MQLLKKKQKQFIASGRDTRITLHDPRFKEHLLHKKMTLNSVPKKGACVSLLDNSNLSTGGDAVDVTNDMHPGFKKIAVQLTRDMGLRICGVDLMVEGDLREKPGKYWVLEINAAPGLDHYVKTGKAQEKIVEQMYMKVLEAME